MANPTSIIENIVYMRKSENVLKKIEELYSRFHKETDSIKRFELTSMMNALLWVLDEKSNDI